MDELNIQHTHTKRHTTNEWWWWCWRIVCRIVWIIPIFFLYVWYIFVGVDDYNRFCMLHHLVVSVTAPSEVGFSKMCHWTRQQQNVHQDAQSTYQFYKVNPQCNIVEIVALLCANPTKDNTFGATTKNELNFERGRERPREGGTRARER